MLGCRSTTRRCRASRIGAMRRGDRRLVMLGVPEMTAVINGAVTSGVIEVDIGDVLGEIVGERPPALIRRLHESREESGDGVVLIVVVRNQRLVDRFVVRV